MSHVTVDRALTIADIRARKGGTPLVCLTAASAPFTTLLDPLCDLLLVGDSLSMVLYGERSTLSVGLETMIRHGRTVAAQARHALVVVDMPFGSYQESPEQAFHNAARLMSETGCAAVKLEGGRVMAETVRFLTGRGVPVLGHIGLQPQSVNALGGYGARGRAADEAQAIAADALAIAEAGAFAIVVEGVVEPLARQITAEVEVPTIGIGASPACDGQILVAEDMLGLFEGFRPRFVRRYADLAGAIRAAVSSYAEDVRSRRFPGPEHLYGAKRGTETKE